MIIVTLDRILVHIHSFWKPQIHGHVTLYTKGSIKRILHNCLNYIFNIQFMIHSHRVNKLNPHVSEWELLLTVT